MKSPNLLWNRNGEHSLEEKIAKQLLLSVGKNAESR